VLAQLINGRPDFDPDVWIRRLPAVDLLGALVFQVIGQQISVIAATAVFARLTGRFGGRVPDAGELAALDLGTLRGLGLSRRKAATVLDVAQRKDWINASKSLLIVVGRQGPPVTEDDRLAGAPVLEEDLSSVPGREIGHECRPGQASLHGG
jgi:hypothetical protein